MTLKVGIVGIRGLSAALGIQSYDGDAEVVAVCDLQETFMRERSAMFRIPHTYRVYEDMLASDIDAVFVATPMHLHVQHTIQALEAGKHVFCEVTAGVTMDELWWLKEAVEKHGKVYMMGENYCYIPQNQLIGQMIREGRFGEVYYAEGEYLHNNRKLAYGYNRRQRELDPWADRTSWRHYWQLGKRGNFYPTHELGPLMQWFQGDRIESVACFGSGSHTAPEFRQEDTSITMVRLRSGKLLKLRLDCISNRPIVYSYFAVQGTKGAYESPRGLNDSHKVYFHKEGTDREEAVWEPLENYYEELPERYRNATPAQKRVGHWGGDFFIVHDFIDAIRGLKPIPIDVYDACEWSAVAMLSELSIMNGGRVIAMPDFRQAKTTRDQELKLW
ncbi:Gfo/Idh/MocA family protein [Paenibacillus ginsengarvi]|uniref:Gfo/Idh/MocA family oxidoreductase n=1 Tax=Paenibacillus ginsengarvi TaxID=400777 RepID=A0A3B0CMS2_9BACL|nr:Gfo/Idh/MocA family oxidoreductase [Paenibacillus ginsengarvi]RKN86171.1 gfo/Idh/MocA family oxidoreductase [Paenibacillus ginsengarvi]